MKAIVHVPTEQYGFVSAEFDTDNAEKIKEAYDAISYAFKPQPINSLDKKDWNTFIERVLLGESNHIETWEKCSPEQQKILQEIKKALARIEAKNNPKPLRIRNDET